MDADLNTALQRLTRYRELAMVNFAKVVLPSEAECRAVLERLAPGPQPAGALVQGLPPERQAFVFRALAWLVKLGGLKAA